MTPLHSWQYSYEIEKYFVPYSRNSFLTHLHNGLRGAFFQFFSSTYVVLATFIVYNGKTGMEVSVTFSVNEVHINCAAAACWCAWCARSAVSLSSSSIFGRHECHLLTICRIKCAHIASHILWNCLSFVFPFHNPNETSHCEKFFISLPCQFCQSVA